MENTNIYVITVDLGYDGGEECSTVDCTPAQIELIRERYKEYEGDYDIQPLDTWVNSKRMQSWRFDKLTAGPQRGIWWLAVCTEEVQNEITYSGKPLADYLYDALGFNEWAGGKYNWVKHHHVTLAFNVTAEDKPKLSYWSSGGRTWYGITVKGLAYNDKAACFVVDLGFNNEHCCNKVAHITLATTEGVPPVYSNTMLAGEEGAYNFLPLEAELEGTLEFFEFQ